VAFYYIQYKIMNETPNPTPVTKHKDNGTTILLVFLLLILIGVAGFAYWYYVYRCHAKDWSTSNLVDIDKTLDVSNVNISLCTAQATARKGGYPAFFLVSNTSGKYDAYYYPKTQKTISLGSEGTATLYYLSNTITISSSVPSPSLSPSSQIISPSPSPSSQIISPSPSPSSQIISPSPSPSPSPSYSPATSSASSPIRQYIFRSLGTLNLGTDAGGNYRRWFWNGQHQALQCTLFKNGITTSYCNENEFFNEIRTLNSGGATHLKLNNLIYSIQDMFLVDQYNNKTSSDDQDNDGTLEYGTYTPSPSPSPSPSR
jgi:hypothetical protein